MKSSSLNECELKKYDNFRDMYPADDILDEWNNKFSESSLSFLDFWKYWRPPICSPLPNHCYEIDILER